MILFIIFGMIIILIYLLFQIGISDSEMIQEFEIEALKIKKCKTLIDLKEINHNLYRSFKQNGLNDYNVILIYCSYNVPQAYYPMASFEGFDNTGNRHRSCMYYYNPAFKEWLSPEEQKQKFKIMMRKEKIRKI